jgi:hypothetical protein
MGIEDLGNISVAGPSHSIPMFSKLVCTCAEHR